MFIKHITTNNAVICSDPDITGVNCGRKVANAFTDCVICTKWNGGCKAQKEVTIEVVVSEINKNNS
jgi:hypothetical protein